MLGVRLLLPPSRTAACPVSLHLASAPWSTAAAVSLAKAGHTGKPSVKVKDTAAGRVAPWGITAMSFPSPAPRQALSTQHEMLSEENQEG